MAATSPTGLCADSNGAARRLGEGLRLSVNVHVHARRGHNLAYGLQEEGFLEPLLRSHLGVALASTPAGWPTVAQLTESANRRDAPPIAAGARPIRTKEERLERVIRVNAGHSAWEAREESAPA